MNSSVARIIQTAGSGSSEDLLVAAERVASISIDLKQREQSFPGKFGVIIREIFGLQIGLLPLLEEFSFSLSPGLKAIKEAELRTRLADIATALSTFEERVKGQLSRGFALNSSTPAASRPASVDVGILTVIPPELRAARRVYGLSDEARYMTHSGTVYWLSDRLQDDRGHQISVALGCIADAGNYDAAGATSRMIATVKPKLMLLVGIAAGVRDKVRIGEIVLSERVIAYEYGALVVDEQNGSSVQPRPEITRPSHRMRQALAAYDVEEAVVRVRAIFRETGGIVPARREDVPSEEWDANVSADLQIRGPATIATGEKLLRNPDKLRSLRKEVHGKIEVGEMEASGFSKSCDADNVEWMVIRGISDFGDEFKDDRFHDFASHTAAAAALDFTQYASSHLVHMSK